MFLFIRSAFGSCLMLKDMSFVNQNKLWRSPDHETSRTWNVDELSKWWMALKWKNFQCEDVYLCLNFLMSEEEKTNSEVVCGFGNSNRSIIFFASNFHFVMNRKMSGRILLILLNKIYYFKCVQSNCFKNNHLHTYLKIKYKENS